MITVITVGKKHETWTTEAIERYEKRLKKPWNIEWKLLPHSSLEGDSARDEESSRILARISPDDYIILLDETGKNIDSPTLSLYIQQQFTSSRPVTIVIGGAYGVNAALHHRANFIWSLSKLVFPHQLVRIILAEQLYRAQSISVGAPYHHK